jgi:membrane-bound lytic murein transglycosylase MltF
MSVPYSDLVQFYARRFDVPYGLAIAQMMAESSGNAGARSKVGAIGLFQVMPSTAAWLEQQPEPAIMSGIWFLRRLYNEVADAATDADRWKFALAAYNEGPGALEKAREQAFARGLDRTRWEDVNPFTPPETQHYVATIWKAFAGPAGAPAGL